MLQTIQNGSAYCISHIVDIKKSMTKKSFVGLQVLSLN